LHRLFTIRQVCACCGLSRATILRLESRGLLVPARIDAQTGYRYYDRNNVSRIMQIKLFLSMDLTYDDILLYFRSKGTSLELLTRIEKKYHTIKRAYEVLKLRLDRQEHLSFEFITLPETVCYSKEFRGATIDSRYNALYLLYQEAVEKGFHLLASDPLFIINKRTDFLEGAFTEGECDFVCCIPLEPDCAPEEAVVYPSCRAFSCLWYGDYTHWADAYNEFGKKIRELGLKPTGYVRSIMLVAPYTGLEIPVDWYLSRFAVPVEE